MLALLPGLRSEFKELVPGILMKQGQLSFSDCHHHAPGMPVQGLPATDTGAAFLQTISLGITELGELMYSLSTGENSKPFYHDTHKGKTG